MAKLNPSDDIFLTMSKRVRNDLIYLFIYLDINMGHSPKDFMDILVSITFFRRKNYPLGVEILSFQKTEPLTMTI